MLAIRFDLGNPDLALLRQIILDRLRAQPGWDQLPSDCREMFAPYLETNGPEDALNRCVFRVFSELVHEGVIAPGKSCGNYSATFPWFHVTAYGRLVLSQPGYSPHDPIQYFRLLKERVRSPDPTVVVYLGESLDAFIRGSLIASNVMLGVAAERVLDLICDSLEPALASHKEQDALGKLRRARATKARVEWVHHKLRRIQDERLEGFPENAAMMTTGIHDMVRMQRNDLGHPQPQPPKLSRPQAQANLLMFPTSYETAEFVRTFLGRTKV